MGKKGEQKKGEHFLVALFANGRVVRIKTKKWGANHSAQGMSGKAAASMRRPMSKVASGSSSASKDDYFDEEDMSSSDSGPAN
jgi:hypothetical protein